MHYNYSLLNKKRKYANIPKNHAFPSDRGTSVLNEKVAQYGIIYCEIFFWISLDVGWIVNCIACCEQGNRKDFSRP